MFSQCLLMLLTYIACVATVAGWQVPGVVSLLWLDVAILIAVALASGRTRSAWCVGLGLLAELIAPQIPGGLLLAGVACGWLVANSEENRSAEISSLNLAWILWLSRLGMASLAGEPLWPFLTGGLLTMLIALSIDQFRAWRENRRQADLQAAVRRSVTSQGYS